jgi:hypothetical protein
MALQFGDTYYCKVTYSENQRWVTRRVTCIEVQRSDGRVVRIRGSDLPDAIAIQTGPQSDSDGKGLLQAIELPGDAFASASSTSSTGTPGVQVTVENNAGRTQHRFFNARDGFIFVMGMLSTTILFLWMFTGWVSLHDLGSRVATSAQSYGYQPRYGLPPKQGDSSRF